MADQSYVKLGFLKGFRWNPSWQWLAVAGLLGIGTVQGQQAKPSDADVDRAMRVCSLGMRTDTGVDAGIEGGLDLLRRRIAAGLGGTLSRSEIPSVIGSKGSGVESDPARVELFEKIQKCVVDHVYGQTPPPQPRNPNALYQYDEPVAEAQGAVISQAQGTVTFQVVRTSGKADPTRDFKYQDWILLCPDVPRLPPNIISGLTGAVAPGVKSPLSEKLSNPPTEGRGNLEGGGGRRQESAREPPQSPLEPRRQKTPYQVLAGFRAASRLIPVFRDPSHPQILAPSCHAITAASQPPLSGSVLASARPRRELSVR